MSTMYRPYSRLTIPAYRENAALQLVVASGVTFIMFHFVRVIMQHIGKSPDEVFILTIPNIGLPALAQYPAKFWTLLTYGWVHMGFWEWFSSMVWLYCFGSVLQSLVSYRQVIPLYIYGLLAGGIFYLATQFIPSPYLEVGNHFHMGAQAGVMALAAACLTLEPRYRIHIAPGFSIPLPVLAGIYFLLNMLVYIPGQLNGVSLALGGALMGFLYAKALRAGNRPGEWIYDALGRIAMLATPDEARISERKNKKRNEVLRSMYGQKGTSKKQIDDILDKINERGYQSLSKEEKDILLRASKDKD